MGFLKIVRDKIKKIPTILSNRGFTFIEVLVALTILIVIVFAFTPLLVGSINRIHFAGDKSEALYEGQSEMEVDIAERRTIDGYELVFTYGDNEDTEIVVPGGLVDVEKTKGDASAWLRGLVPFVPTINLYPSLIIEGHETPLKMSVLGRETDFELAKSNNRRFIIYDRHGNKVEEQLITSVSNLEDDVYDQEAEFNITKNLTNYGSPYIISLTWEIEDEIEVTTRGRLKVKLPYALAVGEGQRIWISPNARETWREKTQITGTGQFRDVTWSGFEYVAVSSSGKIAVWEDRQEIYEAAHVAGTLNSVVYGGGKYISVGNNGTAVISTNAETWESYEINEAYNCDLKAVAWSNSVDEYVSVGTHGKIISSKDGESWNSFVLDVDEDENGDENDFDPVMLTFNSVSYGANTWIAVGKDGEGKGVVIKFDPTSGNWEDITYKLPEESKEYSLNDIMYDGERFIAVGDGGTVLQSTNGSSWSKISVNTTKDLNSVSWGDISDESDHYIIAGKGGTIITWTGIEGDNWVVQNSGITNDIMGVTLKWRD